MSYITLVYCMKMQKNQSINLNKIHQKNVCQKEY